MKLHAVDVSVIIPAYNEEQYIRNAVNSILKQTLKNIEIIIVDDASTDGTREIISRITDTRIKLVCNSCNMGVVNCLNIGIGHSSGKYIARMDADDISLPNRLKKQFSYMENNPEYVLVGSGIYLLNYKLNEYRKIIPPCDSGKIKSEMLTHNPVNTGTAFYRAKSLRSVNGFDTKDSRGEGYSILLKLAEIGVIGNIPDVEYVYFVRGVGKNRCMDKGYRLRNNAMKDMTSRALAFADNPLDNLKAYLASKVWMVYHLIPRNIQIIIRNIVSSKKHVNLNYEEIKELERIYNDLAI